jgi:hypothetical protein
MSRMLLSSTLPRSTLIFSGLMALALSSAAFAMDAPKVSKIDVQIDMAVLTNATAAKHFANIKSDLENALTSRLVNQLGPDGVKITIDLSEFELSNSYKEAMNLADTRLVGTVSVTDLKNNANFDNWMQTVDVNSSAKYLPAGTDLSKLTPDSDVYYKAMIASFADNVVLRLDK